MKRRVTFVELPVFSGVLPLASGYMEAYCRRDPRLADAFAFEKISLSVKTPFEQVVSRVEQAAADVYAFSCYVWNTGMVRRLVDHVLTTDPRRYVILGGPQVMHQADQYLRPDRENVLICNGEGERTFAGFLGALLSPSVDFSSVKGLSFRRDGELITTEHERRIEDLSEIPSPFLDGVFETHEHTWMVVETNRGCPFKCNYCFWGAATGARVHKYEDERLQREFEWISRSGCVYLFIADANWGILKRDVDLTRHIVDCQRRFGSPMWVMFCASKNNPERAAEISGILQEAGLIVTQSVALQTMSDEALKRVDRKNIKTSAYVQMQRTLNDQGIASYMEIIWPLPGETLASFEEGIGRLCTLGADCFIVYPLLLMNNVELAKKRQEYGLVTIHDPDPNSEAELVVATEQVSLADYENGARYCNAVSALYSLRGLRTLARHLNGSGLLRYADLFRRFVAFWQTMPDHPWSRFCEGSIRAIENAEFSNQGELAHRILHAEREAFDEIVEAFVSQQPFWSDPLCRFFFEVDLINRPYVYANTPILPKRSRFAYLSVAAQPDGYAVEVPPEYRRHLAGEVELDAGAETVGGLEVIHRRTQLPFMPHKPLHDNLMYCNGVVHRPRTLMPVWRGARVAVA